MKSFWSYGSATYSFQFFFCSSLNNFLRNGAKREMQEQKGRLRLLANRNLFLYKIKSHKEPVFFFFIRRQNQKPCYTCLVTALGFPALNPTCVRQLITEGGGEGGKEMRNTTIERLNLYHSALGSYLYRHWKPQYERFNPVLFIPFKLIIAYPKNDILCTFALISSQIYLCLRLF